MTTTYTEYATQTASEKITLVHLHAKRQVRLFNYSGSGEIYTRNPQFWVVGVQVDGTTYTEVSGVPVTNQFNYDPSTNTLSVNSSTTLGDREVVLEYRLFLSDAPITTSYNLTDTGFHVPYEPMIQGIPGFTTSLSFANNNTAITGRGTLTLDDTDSFFTNLLRTYRFENKQFQAYSFNRNIAPSEARIIYRGFVTQGSLNDRTLSFQIKDTIFGLGTLIPATQFTSSEVIANDTSRFKKRIFGRVDGMRVQSTSQVGTGFPVTGTVSGSEGSSNVTGVGTMFNSEVASGDRLNISGQTLTVKEVIDDGFLTLNENSTVLFNNISITDLPVKSFFNTNRTYNVAEHPLKQFQTTIVSFLDNSRIQVASIENFEAGDQIVVLNEQYGVRRVGNSVGINNVITLDRTFSLNNFPIIGSTVTKREVQDVKLQGTSIASNQFTISNVDGQDSTISLASTAEQSIAQEAFLPTDATLVVGTEYLIAGTPAIQTIITSGITNYLGSYIHLSGTSMLERFVWITSRGSVIANYAQAAADLVFFNVGEVYFNTDDQTNYGIIATQQGTVGQVDIGSNPILVEITQGMEADFAHASQQLKRAIDSTDNIIQKFSSEIQNSQNTWLLFTNQGISTSITNVLTLNNGTAVSTFVSGREPQLDFDFSEFLNVRDTFRIPEIDSLVHRVLSVSTKSLRTAVNISSIQGAFFGQTETSSLIYKNPSYLTDTSLVTVDAFGQTEDNTKTGTWIKTPGDAIEKVLIDNGLTNLIDISSFDNLGTDDLTIGIYTPYSLTTTPPTVIDFTDKVSISGLSSIGLNNNFQIKLQPLVGNIATSLDNIRRVDNNETITEIRETLNPSPLFRYTVSNIDIQYNFGENDPKSTLLRLTDPAIERLTDLNTTQDIDLYFSSETDASTIANRYLEYNQRINRRVEFTGPLSLEDIVIGNVIFLDFIELTNFIGMVTSITRNGNNISLVVEDFGGLFINSAIYTSSTLGTYTNSTSVEQLLNGYYTNSQGLIDGTEDTFGRSVYS